MFQRIGRYENFERIAADGQGTVYRARDTVLDRVVAVKVINQPVTDDPQYLEALQREARLAARLDHPNITRVHDFQVEGDTAYIVMEYVPDSLDKHVRVGTAPAVSVSRPDSMYTGGRPAGAAVDVRDGRQVHVLSSSTG